jgi:3-oxosteroid 1-dehydrogenase
MQASYLRMAASSRGLYAAGNNTASVMGHTYPGPGRPVAPAGIFGFLGALYAAQHVQQVAHPAAH